MRYTDRVPKDSRSRYTFPNVWKDPMYRTLRKIDGVSVNPWFNPFRYVAFTQAVIFNSLVDCV